MEGHCSGQSLRCSLPGVIWVCICVVSLLPRGAAGQVDLDLPDLNDTLVELPPATPPRTRVPEPPCGSMPICSADSDCCSGFVCSRGRCDKAMPSLTILVAGIVGTSLCCCCVCCCLLSHMAYARRRAEMESRELRGRAFGDSEPFSHAANRGPQANMSQLKIGYEENVNCPDQPHMLCPISLQLMRDPVYCGCGTHTFERVCLEAALHNAPVCPMSRSPMTLEDIRPNDALREEIEKYVEDWRQADVTMCKECAGEDAVEESPQNEGGAGLEKCGGTLVSAVSAAGSTSGEEVGAGGAPAEVGGVEVVVCSGSEECPADTRSSSTAWAAATQSSS